MGNNTYTGSTILNAGNDVVTGSSLSTSLKIEQAYLSIETATGAFNQASSIQVYGGGSLTLDNNSALNTNTSTYAPYIPGGSNGDRISDSAVVTLRDGTFSYKGFLNASGGSETYGSLSLTGGSNTLGVSSLGTGTSSLIAAGTLTMSSGSTLLVSGTGFGTTNTVLFQGGVPTADSTGILPRVVTGNGTSTDFAVYNTSIGILPYTGYATSVSGGANANVQLSAGSTVSTNSTVNAIKTTATLTTSIAAGTTLNVSSGMILSASGTATYNAPNATSVIAFGSKPAVFFGTNTITTVAMSGTGGVISNGSLTLNGDMSNLSGTLIINAGTTTIKNISFPGAIWVRSV
jgi:hypothetical protein